MSLHGCHCNVIVWVGRGLVQTVWNHGVVRLLHIVQTQTHHWIRLNGVWYSGAAALPPPNTPTLQHSKPQTFNPPTRQPASIPIFQLYHQPPTAQPCNTSTVQAFNVPTLQPLKFRNLQPSTLPTLQPFHPHTFKRFSILTIQPFNVLTIQQFTPIQPMSFVPIQPRSHPTPNACTHKYGKFPMNTFPIHQ